MMDSNEATKPEEPPVAKPSEEIQLVGTSVLMGLSGVIFTLQKIIQMGQRTGMPKDFGDRLDSALALVSKMNNEVAQAVAVRRATDLLRSLDT